MRNKKLITPLFLAASFLLIGCSSDTIVARPKWQDKDIVDISGLKDNKLKSIYDAIKSLGDTNSNVLNRVMYDIAKQHIGNYEDLKDIGSKDESQIETIIKNPEFLKFVKEHSIYQVNGKGATLNEIGKKDVKIDDFTSDEKLKLSYYKIKAQYERIEEDIAEKLYNEIKGGSYNGKNDKLFHEELYVQHLRKELYETKEKLDGTDKYKNPSLILPLKQLDGATTKYEQYVDVISTYLTTDTTINRYKDYVDRKILPDLYKTYLTETYVKQQRFSSLGRSYARKVNMIAIPYGSDKEIQTKINNMLYWFSKNYITGTNADTGINIPNQFNFEYINEAMTGFVGVVPDTKPTSSTSIPYQLLNYTINNEYSGTEPEPAEYWKTRTNFDKVNDPNTSNTLVYHMRTSKYGVPLDDTNKYATTNTTHVYKGTKLGEMIQKLLKFTFVTGNGNNEKFNLKNDRTDEENTAYNEFTNNQAQSIEESIALREAEIRSTDYSKNGWFLKNGGLTEIDTTDRDHLFNITASNIVDEFKKITDYKGYAANDSIRYFGEISNQTIASKYDNRKAFLITESEDLYKSVVIKGKSNAFIVQVEEAPNTSKLSSVDNNYSYVRSKAKLNDKLASTKVYDEIVRDLVKTNSNSDTYKKNANEYYLMISNIVFYDQSVYDYFKSQFPDLFK